MTANHLTDEQRSGPMSIGTYGWDGGLGTSWRNDPQESLTGICLTQASFADPSMPKLFQNFWTCAYAAIDD